MTKKLILIGGMPGSGKTHVGKSIAKRIGMFVDKDALCQSFTEKLLQTLGASINDRETEIYLGHVRALEYETMMSHALENLSLGHSVICSAPFSREFGDPKWLEDIGLKTDLLDAEIVKIWIHVDYPTARRRIVSRGAGRDIWKIINWDAYTAADPNAAPSNLESLVIDNSRSPRTLLPDQIKLIMKKISGVNL